MSYIRFPLYAYGDDTHINLLAWGNHAEVTARVPDNDHPDFSGGISIPHDLFDALVLYRVAELLDDPDAWDAAVESATERAGGNFNTYSFLQRIVGEETFENILEARMQQLRDRYRDNPTDTVELCTRIVDKGSSK